MSDAAWKQGEYCSNEATAEVVFVFRCVERGDNGVVHIKFVQFVPGVVGADRIIVSEIIVHPDREALGGYPVDGVGRHAVDL